MAEPNAVLGYKLAGTTGTLDIVGNAVTTGTGYLGLFAIELKPLPNLDTTSGGISQSLPSVTATGTARLTFADVTAPISGDPTPSDNIPIDVSSFNLIWHDEFDGVAGTKPTSPWFFFRAFENSSQPEPWGPWRDAKYDTDHAVIDGQSNLIISCSIDGSGELVTSYLSTFDFNYLPNSQITTFGPQDGEIYIEYSVKLTDYKIGGTWFAAWLYDWFNTGGGTLAYEIDVMEYLPTSGGAGSWAENISGGLFNSFNVAVHSSAGSEGFFVHVGDTGLAIQIDDGNYHTYGARIDNNQVIFHLDGYEVYTMSDPTKISSGSVYSPVLSIESDIVGGGHTPDGDVWAVADSYNNHLDEFINGNNKVYIDYVRVYQLITSASSPPPPVQTGVTQTLPAIQQDCTAFAKLDVFGTITQQLGAINQRQRALYDPGFVYIGTESVGGASVASEEGVTNQDSVGERGIVKIRRRLDD